LLTLQCRLAHGLNGNLEELDAGTPAAIGGSFTSDALPATMRVAVAELPTGTVTLLFSDVDGSTELVKGLGERYGDVLADHRRLVREAFTEHRGIEVDTQGDSFFVAFASARDAVAAAVSAQRALSTHPWDDGVEVRVRMGLHTCEPHVSNESYVGVGVHRAARICTIGHGGQVLLSRSAAGIVADGQIPYVAVRDLGEQGTAGVGWVGRAVLRCIELCDAAERADLRHTGAEQLARGRGSRRVGGARSRGSAAQKERRESTGLRARHARRVMPAWFVQ